MGEGDRRPDEQPRPPRWSLHGVALVAALSTAAGAGGAAATIVHRVWPDEPGPVDLAETAPERSSPTPTPNAPRRRSGGPTPPGVELDEVVVEVARERQKARRQRPAPEPASTAEELLERADAARRAGRHRDAAARYRELQERYPGTREQHASRVTLGRVLLDHLHDPGGALTQFEAYLGASTPGTLTEEARVGRALALAQLGRRAEERTAWQDLVARHPRSRHAERARQRIAALGGAR